MPVAACAVLSILEGQVNFCVELATALGPSQPHGHATEGADTLQQWPN